jgi:very-short-patch-repair endonuclease
MPEELPGRRRDAAIARLAGRQHGVVSVQQLHAAGLSPSAISDRAAAGRLHRIHRGVYAVGHSGLGNEGRWMAAVLAYGDGAILSHTSAAQLWRMLRESGAATEAAHVTVPRERKSRQGIRLHRSATLSSADSTVHHGIPVTTPARTLEDLRRSFPGQIYAKALREAEFLRLPIGGRAKVDHTRSELEAQFLILLRRRRLPQPEVNVRIDRFVVDFLWRPEGLIVEVDGWGSHGRRSAFEQDRSRDARLKLLGFDVVRFTWRQITGERAAIAATIRGLLRGRSVWGRT